MGILSNTVSICQYDVLGELPREAPYEWVSDRLAQNGFSVTDNSTEELSFGWVHLDDPTDASFATPTAFWRDHYVAFTLRRDQRRVPPVLLKANQEKAEKDYLASNPQLKWIPKEKRNDMRDAVRSALVAKALPLPATYDAVWDTNTGRVTFASLSPNIQELFEHLFEKTFKMRLVLVHPFARAEKVLNQTLRQALRAANCAPTETVTDLIKGNRWLGWDFLVWLMFQTMNGSSEYQVKESGSDVPDQSFVAYLDDRMILVGGNEDKIQKITVAGPQDHFREALTALQNGKQITETTLYLEKEDRVWRMTLKGDTFVFGSFRCPSVHLERDEITDEASEREAVFYERMHLIEQGLKFFDSLYACFLAERLGNNWERTKVTIRDWILSNREHSSPAAS